MSTRRGPVMVGVDGSDEAVRAVRFGAAVAARRRVPLRLVHAFGWVTEHSSGHAPRGGRYRDQLLDRARSLVSAAAGVAVGDAPRIDVEQQVVVGYPIEVLVDESRLLAGSVSVALATNALGGPRAPEEAETAAHEVLAERLAGWTEKYPDVRVRRAVVQDRPVHALVREAGAAQLVVVGSRGHGRPAAMAPGSVAHAMVHRAPCPVAVVRPEGGAR
jgi:nucleotide-binding universal stress UspA family protein